jgi:hypothetical protein
VASMVSTASSFDSPYIRLMTEVVSKHKNLERMGSNDTNLSNRGDGRSRTGSETTSQEASMAEEEEVFEIGIEP